MPKIGAHVSSAGSASNSFENALKIGAESTQIFITPPQQWFQKLYQDEEIEKYLETKKISGITPNFIHGSYLINLATDKPENLKKATSWLAYSLNTASKLGMEGTIFHVGSSKNITFQEALPQVVLALKTILSDSEGADLILENCAGAGNLIGDTIDELSEIIEKVGDRRVKICLDTQHLFASGYDIRSEEIINKLLAEFDKKIGLKNLAAFHANDSKTEFNSKRDRHENIGEGFIGKEAFKILLNHPKLTSVPFILEVPGFEEKGPDKKNIDILKSLINS